jgi:hypothetical protein
MNGVDYTKQMAKERDYFQDTIQKNKQASDKRISDVEKHADNRMDKQREAFIEDKTELETNYKKSLNHLKDRTSAAIDDNKNQSRGDIAREREEFTKQSQIKSKDFDQRLNDIKSSYEKAFDSQKENHNELQKTQHNRYKRNVGELVEKTDKSLSEYQDRMKGAGADIKDQHNRERQQLVRAHEDQLLKVYKDNAEKRADQREQINTHVKKTKEIHEKDMASQKQYTEDRLKNLQNKAETRVQDMAADYSKRSDNLAATQQKQQVTSNKEHQKHLSEVREGFNKQIKFIELEKRRRDNGSDEFNEVVEKQQGLKNKKGLEKRLEHMHEDFVTQKNDYQERLQNEQNIFNEALKKESTEATANMDRKVFKANADKIVTVSYEREKAQEAITNRERQNKLNNDRLERQMSLERISANNRLTKLKENFNTSMVSLEEKHRNDIEEVSTTAHKDKKVFQKDLQERRNNEIFEMKREFTKLMDNTVIDYENRLSDYQRENEILAATMDQKIQHITDQAQKTLDSERKLAADRRAADLRSHQMLQDQRDNVHKTQVNEISGGMQRKMTLMQTENDRKMKLLTSEYENKLKTLAAQKDSEANMKDIAHTESLERLKLAYEQEKQRLVSQYQAQIDSAKKNHDDQIEQLKGYNKLS